MPSTQDSATSSTLSYFDGESSGWSNRYQNSRHFRNRLSQALAWLPEKTAPLNLLDFGCGSGVLVSALLGMGHNITAVDASAGMIASTREHLQASGFDPKRYHLETLTQEDGQGEYLRRQYDGIYSLGVLEYVPAPHGLLSLWAKLLPPGGVLVLSLPNRHSLLRQLEGFIYRNPSLFSAVPGCKHLTGPDCYLIHQKHQFSLADLDRVLQPLGFQRQNAEFGVAPDVLSGLEKSPLVGMTLMVRYQKI